MFSEYNHEKNYTVHFVGSICRHVVDVLNSREKTKPQNGAADIFLKS